MFNRFRIFVFFVVLTIILVGMPITLAIAGGTEPCAAC